ncbi:YceI family protein [Chryseobacterium sp. A301]
MKRSLVFSLLSLCLVLGFFVSCTKDKAIASETGTVVTGNEGVVYTLDTLNSRMEWIGYKVFKSQNTSHFGSIKFESGEITVHEGKLESGKFVADLNSLENIDLKDDPEQQQKLENHLKSADFFEVDKFPTASYEITQVSAVAEGDYNTILDGNLTMKGITKPVQFRANVTVNGNEVSIASEPTDIKREDFGVKFQVPAQNGIIKNEVTVQLLVKALEKV